ncbi:single-stranded DNA-binding protein [Carnobacterium divergens]|uniref:single-stranded DNA-binding protein n=1 Tax=Carnobacterium divergens TaxID=2748 RepID=UPI001072B85D|nr:single-stranded DNA-binding protein [Carnobacterium divergens]MDT1995188.1 single-stranded DNA-binding protein [Carnobacterium divergens]TFI68786.1 single-stranded DNA-binding protein [Carnobacterium divergens]TFI81258.1 single-stranded DNA-binding protein [Carnobacterium divergens]TFI88750.1 single-stranded DNA-binding protein [Carnobacterium divergens]TFI90121.1 single-stranded DNA-binding protein [Carnobacterium divergens]
MNSVNLIGRLTSVADLTYSSNGIALASVTIAVKRAFKTGDGLEADFIRLKAFRKTAELLANVEKGKEIGISGSWQTGSYENAQGTKVYTNDCIVQQITFIGSKSTNNDEREHQQSYKANPNNYKQQNYGSEIDIKDDDLPF